jgi:Holliday junction resolvase
VTANETAIRKQIQDYLRWTGWFVYYNLAGLGSYPGLSDLVAVRGGRVVHIEVKTPKGVQSEKQRRFQRKLEAAGGEYVLARGIEDVEHLAGEKQLSLERR